MKHSFTRNLAKFLLGAVLPLSAVSATDTTGNASSAAANDWLQVVNVSDKGGLVMGNPDAATKIVEYASYTCGHCGQFEVIDAPLIKSNEVAYGNVSFEMRSLIRDGHDLTVAILARCSGKENFFASHQYWMSSQKEWLAGANLITTETEEKLQKRDLTGFLAGAYKDMRLAPHAAKTGLTSEQASTCLADSELIGSLLEMTNDAIDNLKINGTPTLLVNDTVVEAHNYPTLKPLLATK
jgi:protein-disulfide isomerase